jgi:O-antigen/teichoic acid export membrane protein
VFQLASHPVWHPNKGGFQTICPMGVSLNHTRKLPEWKQDQEPLRNHPPSVPFFKRLKLRLAADPRLARMLHGGASNFAGRGIALVVSAVTLPLTVRYLGKLEYGVWITISTSVVMLSVLDLGIANTLTNFISSAYASDDKEAAQGYFATAFWLTCAVALVLGVGAAVVYHLLNWGSLLGISDPGLIAQAKLCVLISIAFFLISLPLNLANRVLSGYQQVHVANYFAMINSLLGLVAIVSTVLLRGSIVQLMLSYCIAMLTGTLLLNLWLSIWHKPWIRAYPSRVKPQLARALFGQGSLFFVLQLTSIVVFNSDNLVITHYLGAAEVTPYSIAWRLTGYASMLQNMLIPSFWPAFTEAYHKRDMPWVRSTYRNLSQKSLMAVAAAAIGIGLFGQIFIRIWAGSSAIPPHLLLWTMASWAILVCVTTNQALLLTATSRLKLEAIVAVIAAIVNLALSIFLVQRIGAEGVILSTILSFAVCMVVPQQLEVGRVLRGEFLPQPEPDEAATPSLELEELKP